MKKSLITLLSVAVSSIAVGQFNPQPIAEFTFIGGTANQPNTGSAVTVDTLNTRASDGTETVFTVESGVSGLPGDFAFNGVVTSIDPNNPLLRTGNFATFGGSDAALSQIDGLSSMTLQGWFKSPVAANDNNKATFFSNASGGAGFSMTPVNDGQLRLFVNGGNVISTNGAWSAVDEWVYFAVSYDGTQTTDNVSFYVGGVGQAVTLSSVQTLNQGLIVDDTGRFGVSQATRSYNGLLDNLRIFGSSSDASGALSIVDLEAVRVADVTGVPEPSVYAFLLGCLAFGFVLRQRKRA